MLILTESRASLRTPGSYEREDNITENLEGTCSWILSSDEYQRWIQSGGVLLIRGNPGCGKSTLLKYALTCARQKKCFSKSLMISFFFDASGTESQNSIISMLRSLLDQLVEQDEQVRPAFHEAYCKQLARHGGNSKLLVWKQQPLIQTVRALLQISTGSYMTKIFIDAIDECQDGDRDDIIRFLHSLGTSNSTDSSNLALFLTSRHHPDGQISFDQRIDLQQRTQNDIQTYIREILRLPKASDTTRAITGELQDRADGSFLWLSLLIPRINILHSQGSSKMEMLREIEQRPQRLDELYRELVDRIDAAHLLEASRLFQWMCYGKRRLKVSELRTALAVHATGARQSLRDYLDECNANYIPDDETMIKRVTYLSQGLVNKTSAADHEDYLGFHHTSITQFILATGFDVIKGKLSETGKFLEDDNSCFANTCIRFLSTCEIRQAALDGDTDLLSSLSFSTYAADFWLTHAVDAEKMNELATVEWPTYEVLQYWIERQRKLDKDSTFLWKRGTGLVHIAAKHGLVSLARRLLDGQDYCPTVASFDRVQKLRAGRFTAGSLTDNFTKLLITGKKAFERKTKALPKLGSVGPEYIS